MSRLMLSHKLFRTLRGLKAYPLRLFLRIAYVVYHDGIQAVISLAAVDVTAELKLGQTVLVPTSLVFQFVGFGGALLLGRIAARVGAYKTVPVAHAAARSLPRSTRPHAMSDRDSPKWTMKFGRGT